MKASLWDSMTEGENGSSSDGPCSVNPTFCWWVELFPSLLFTWGQTMMEVMKIMANFLKRVHACPATVHAPNPAAGYHWPTPSQETPRHPQVSPGQYPVVSLFLSPGSLCTMFCCALQEPISQSCVMGTITDFILRGSKITADSNWSHEMKRCLLLGRNLWPT